MQVCDIMSKNPAHIGSDASVFAALNLLRDMDVRHLPVVDAGQLVGMVSDRDLQSLSATELEDAALAQSNFDLSFRLKQSISGMMSSNVFFVNPESSITEAIDLMLDHKVGAVPVVDLDNSLIGIVSYIDILKESAKVL